MTLLLGSYYSCNVNDCTLNGVNSQVYTCDNPNGEDTFLYSLGQRCHHIMYISTVCCDVELCCDSSDKEHSHSDDGFRVLVRFVLPNKFSGSNVDGILLSRKYK